MKIALINTMEAAENLTVGRVLSTHRTVEAAINADARLQGQTKRANPGNNAYLPTMIAQIDDSAKVKKGDYVHDEDIVRQDGNTRDMATLHG